jgi:putative SbcD/Mre11-related phosphoesterase
MSEGIGFVTGERALKIGKSLMVADLHIGIEYKYRREGIAMPSQSGRLIQRLESLVRKTRAKRLVILGDVKDKVPGTSFQEEREIPAFFRRLLEVVEVEVTPGNHDAGIEGLLPRGVRLHPVSGFMLDKAWLCHGHAWPDRAFLEAEHVVIGHQHAGIEFRDRLGYRWGEPVWIRAELDRKRLAGRYRDLKENPARASPIKPGREEMKLPELVMMPVFNEFLLSVGANRPMSYIESCFKEGPSPLFRAARRDKARVYMLDGTFLGELGKL